MENLFDNILDSDEKIIKVLKPNKFKFFWSSVLGAIIFTLFFVGFGVMTVTIPDELGEVAPIGLIIVIDAFVVVLDFLLIICPYLSNKKRFYAYSNKRVIIRCGVIGVDYKSLDIDMIGAIDVGVGLLDKLFRKNTGTISFGSVASPMTAGGGAAFSFYSVQNPYELYKEIKTVINETKEKAAKKSKSKPKKDEFV